MDRDFILQETLQLLAKLETHLPKAEVYKVNIVRHNVLELHKQDIIDKQE